MAAYFGVALLTLVAGLVFQKLNIHLALKVGLTDIPTSRRRHLHPMPVVGGVGVVLAWVTGLVIFSIQDPTWYRENMQSLLPIGSGVLLLLGLGLWDDLKGCSPSVKLLIQFIAAIVVIRFEPRLQEVLTRWEQTFGIVVWPVSVLWVVGISNAINLIDGLDGLAGGTSLLIAGAISFSLLFGGEASQLGMVLAGLLVPSILGFLRYNWHPARIFMGDNGSLTIGFILAVTSLMGKPQFKSWIQMTSMAAMFGYPILDMGMAVWRRLQKRQPLFKADRTHLHYRVLRLGLTVPQTTTLLLIINFYLQVTAIMLNRMEPLEAFLGLFVVTFSITSLVWVIRGIETWRTKRLYESYREADSVVQNLQADLRTVVHFEIETLLEAAMFEEQNRWKDLLRALRLMLQVGLRHDDLVMEGDKEMMIVLASDKGRPDEWPVIRARFERRLESFLELYNLQCSLKSIPIRFERKRFISLQDLQKKPGKAA